MIGPNSIKPFSHFLLFMRKGLFLMVNFFLENWTSVALSLCSAGALAFCRYIWKQKKLLENELQTNQNQQYRQMILNEIQPLIDEIHIIKENLSKEISRLETSAQTEHDKMYEDLENEIERYNHDLGLITNSYKFRFIQLCKSHLSDKYISSEDFEQLSEMYQLYTGLGGNGQAKSYYEKVLELPIHE